MSIQVLRGVAATITASLADQNGEPRPAAGDVTVTVVASDGTAVLTDEVVIADGEGNLSFDLTPAETAQLDYLRATYTEDGGATFEQDIEVVGGYYFTIAEARASASKLRDKDKYTDADILAGRRAVQEECQRITRRSFVPRFRRTLLSGRYDNALRLPDPDVRRVRSVDIDGAALDDELFAELVMKPYGELRLGGGSLFNYGEANVAVAYEYGFDSPPERIKQAALLRLQSLAALTKTGATDRAEFQIIEGKVFSLARFRRGLTGIKDVDDAYAEWSAPGSTVASVPVV